MKKEKLDVLIMSIGLSDDSEKLEITHANKYKLTIDELKDTILESIEFQFEDFKMKMEESGKNFDEGVIIMPLIKMNFEKNKV